MNALQRWLKFNCIGAMGMVVQLTTLAALNLCLPRHTLFAVATAVELTLLHNFFWHLHYTWRDRREAGTPLHQALRFHLSNGAVSLTGNLTLMPILVSRAHLPLLFANSVAILACSLVNFTLGDKWSFAETRAL